jgi:CRISPR system Cascade subunit CasD
MLNKFFVLWFEAPLQSWGNDSKFWRRDTLKFPTKSGIIGLILCALGKTGAQIEFLEKLSLSKITVFSYLNTYFKDKLRKKVERAYILRDFHMIGNGYNEEDNWMEMNTLKKLDGKSSGAGVKVTQRFYLQDSKFGVIMEVPINLSDCLEEALKMPVYDIYLGRKNCIPTDFVFQGCFDTHKEAEEKLSQVCIEKKLDLDFTVLDESLPEIGDVISLNDIPIQFGEEKKYRDRQVTIIEA